MVFQFFLHLFCSSFFFFLCCCYFRVQASDMHQNWSFLLTILNSKGLFYSTLSCLLWCCCCCCCHFLLMSPKQLSSSLWNNNNNYNNNNNNSIHSFIILHCQTKAMFIVFGFPRNVFLFTHLLTFYQVIEVAVMLPTFQKLEFLFSFRDKVMYRGWVFFSLNFSLLCFDLSQWKHLTSASFVSPSCLSCHTKKKKKKKLFSNFVHFCNKHIWKIFSMQ